MIYLSPGDKVWYPHQPFLVVQATIEECEDIYDNGDKPAIWHRRSLNGISEISYPTDNIDENGWHIYDHPDESILQDKERVNQLLWIDEPVGHAITLGDECFLTLQEALNTIVPSSKRHLRRRLKRSRGRVKRFIVSTWGNDRQDVPSWWKYENKKVYVKRDRSKKYVNQ
jgi:hypothetical protein